MRRFNTLIIISLLVVVAYTSCKKTTKVAAPGATETGDAKAIIVNNIPDSVYIKLSGHDIATGTLPHIITITLPPRDTFIIPRSELKNFYSYEYNWHTADYLYSNWFKTDGNGTVPDLLFDYYADSTDYILQIDGAMRSELIICLDGNGTSSTWQAVDAFDTNGVTVWSALDTYERSHVFVISRYHTARHFFRDTANKEKITNLGFRMDVSQPRVWLTTADTADSYLLTNNLTPVAQLSTMAEDTLFYARQAIDSSGKISYPPPYYLLTRQSVER